jgi:aminoglycoside phosphotransferase (APT) family kinase protein
MAGPQSDHPVSFSRTAAVASLVRSKGVPVPTVLATDETSQHGPWKYQLLEHLDGTPWRHVRPRLVEPEVADAHRQIAEAVLGVQAVTFDGFGEFDSAGTAPPTIDFLVSLRERATTRLPDDGRRALFLDLLDREAGLFTSLGPPTLCHDDLHHGNVLFAHRGDRWWLSGLLDWDKAWSAHSQSDIARMQFWDDMTGPGFWAVYRAAVPARDGDERRGEIYQLLWCLEYDVPTARHAQDTRALMHRLGVPWP